MSLAREVATAYIRVRGDMTPFRRGLERLSKNINEIGPQIDKNVRKLKGFAGLNVLGDMVRGGSEFFQNLDRNTVKIAKMTLAFGGLASGAIAALAGIATVSADLAAVGNIGILAPAFLTGLGIGIGVLFAALKDTKTVLKDLKPAFKSLQDRISAKFWEQAAAPIRSMVKTLMPTLRTELGKTATAFGLMFAALADSVKAEATPERLGVMFERMNNAIDITTKAVAPLVSAFVRMGEVGSEYFERFASWILLGAERFNTFIQAAAGDGRLNMWIENAITGFKNIGSVINGAWNIMGALNDAAVKAGGQGLAGLAHNVQAVSAALNSMEGQRNLVIIFDAAYQAVASVKEAIIGIGPQLESFLPTFHTVLTTAGAILGTLIGYLGDIVSNPTFQKGVQDFMNGIQKGVDALGPALPEMGDSLGQVLSLMGQTADLVGKLVGSFITSFGPALDQVAAAFGRIAEVAGPQLTGIIETLGPVFQTVMDILLPPLENLISTVLPILNQAFAALAPIFPVIAAALAPVIDAITQLVNQIAPVLVPAITQIVTAATPVIETLGQVASFILSVLVPILAVIIIGAINNLVGAFQGLQMFVAGMVTIVTAIFTGLGEFFTKLFNNDIGGALNALGTMFATIWEGIKQVLLGAVMFLWNAVQLFFIGKMIAGIKAALIGAKAFFTSIWEGIKSFFSGITTSIGSTLVNWLTRIGSGIRTGFTAVKDFIVRIWTSVGTAIATATRNVITTVSGWITSVTSKISAGFEAAKTFVSNAFTAIVTFVSNGVTNVMGFIRGLPGQISSALSGLGSLLVNAGSAIINGLLNGLKAAWGGVTSFVGGIADWIARNKGPIPYDRKLLVPAGAAIMQGLESSLKNKFGDVMDFVSDMAGMMAGNFDKSKMYIAGADASKGLADGLLANKSKIKSAYSDLGALAVTDPTLGAIGARRTDGRTSVPAAGNSITLGEGAVQVITRASDPKLVASSVNDGLDEAFSKFSTL